MATNILYNIALVTARELDPVTLLPKQNGVYHIFRCARQAQINPQYSIGEEVIVRQDYMILNTFKIPDLLYGFNITLEDTYVDDNFLRLIEGGDILLDDENEELETGFQMRMLEDGFVSKPFRLTLYVENVKGTSVSNYVQIVYNYCYGIDNNGTYGDGFYLPTFDIQAREPTKTNQPIRDIYYVDYLPSEARIAVVGTAIVGLDLAG